MKHFFLFSLFLISWNSLAQINIPASGGENRTTCSETLYDMGGSLNGLSANADGSITFYPGNAGNIISVFVEELDIDWFNDYLYIYNGTSSSDPLIKTFQGGWGSGNSIDHREYYGNNSSGAVTVRLKTGKYASSSDAGFRIRVRCVPTAEPHNMISNQKRIVTTCNTTIYDSGGLLGDYGLNSQDTILIIPDSPDKKLQITFQHFALNNNDGFDYLLYPGGLISSPTSTLYQNSGYGLPGSGNPLKSNSENGSISIILSSDGNYKAQGFRAALSCFSETTKAPAEAIVPGTGSASIRTCGTRVSDCGDKYNYPSRSNGSLTIYPEISGKRVSIQFSEFGLAAGDFVTVFDGTSTASNLLGTFTGTDLPPVLTASYPNSSGALTVKFVSDATSEGKGFVFNTSCDDAVPETVVPENEMVSVTGCNLTIFDAGGSSGAYPANSAGRMLITPSEQGKMASIQFVSFSTQADKDVLTIYDGADETAPVLGRFSGNTIPPVLTAENSTGQLYLRFISDETVNAPGFNFNVKCVTPEYKIPASGQKTVKACSGIISNAGGDTTYQNNSSGMLILIPSEGQLARISFTEFSMGKGDTVYVYDGSSQANLLGKYTGKTLPAALTASTTSLDGVLSIRLVSDSSVTDHGLKAQISCVEKAYRIPATGNQVVYTCGSVIYDSGGPEGDYGNKQDGSITIYPDKNGKMVKLSCSTFNTESTYDYVYIFNGKNPSGSMLGMYSGRSLPPSFTATNADGAITIRFISDDDVAKPGFSFKVTCAAAEYKIPVTGKLNITTCSGEIFDSGGAGDEYNNLSDGVITVTPREKGNKVKAEFQHFDLEEDYDFLYVYDGENTDAPLIDTYTGDYLPKSVRAGNSNSSGALTFRFISDEDITYDGFNIKVSCIKPVSSIQIIPADTTIIEGTEINLFATVLPEDATDKSLIWESSDPEIAEVDSEGKVTGISPGSVIIYAISEDGELVAESDIKVAIPTSVSEFSDFVPVVFPNPASQKINIRSGEEEVRVKISDLAGRLQSEGITKHGEFDISNLPAGLFIIEITRGTSSWSKKISVEN